MPMFTSCCCLLYTSQQMEHPALDSAREGLEKYLKGKSDAKSEITVKNAQGDNGTADTIAKQFVSEDVDLILSLIHIFGLIEVI